MIDNVQFATNIYTGWKILQLILRTIVNLFHLAAERRSDLMARSRTSALIRQTHVRDIALATFNPLS